MMRPDGKVDKIYLYPKPVDCGFHDTWTLSPRSLGHSFHAHLDT